MTYRFLIACILLFAGFTHHGYTQKKDTVPTEIFAGSVEDLMESLIRKYNPGVRVYRTNGRLQIRVRGAIREPLYVVDGVPLSGGPGSALAGINPNEIKKVEVITDIARLSRYGMRGGNGVVLITTRR